MKPEFEARTEPELLNSVRQGDIDAFGWLYERYAQEARRFVHRLFGATADAEDVVAESFAKILQRMLAGGGPTLDFRAYLFTTVRTTLYKQLAVDRMVDRSVELSDGLLPAPEADVVIDRLEVRLATRAYDSLPERWRLVLRHLEVESVPTAVVAELLGIRSNAVSALAFRARDALRVAYLQMHVNTDVPARCREATHNLAAWCCGRLTRARRSRMDTHLRGCGRCANAAEELSEMLDGLKRSVPVAVGSARGL